MHGQISHNKINKMYLEKRLGEFSFHSNYKKKAENYHPFHFYYMLIKLLSFISPLFLYFLTPTLNEPLAVPIHRVVSRPICDISWDTPENLSLALTVSCPDNRDQNHQDRQQESQGVGNHPLLHPQRAK